MSSGSPPRGEFREFLKRCGRVVNKVFWPGEQAPVLPLSGNQPRPQPPHGASLPHLAPTGQPSPQSPVRTHWPVPQPQSDLDTGGSISTADPVAAEGVQSANVEQAAKQAGADAWVGLRSALKGLKETSALPPSLKAALEGFLGVVDIFEAAAQNQQDYNELALNLRAMVDEFKVQPGEYTSFKMSEALKTMKEDLKEQLEYTLKQHQRWRLRRTINAEQDVSDLQKCCRRIENLCHELQSTVLITTWSIEKEQKADARLKNLNAVLKATYNSKWSQIIGRRLCTPGTRKSILAGMREWADTPYGPKIYWLNGIAGTGKTTLAYSFCAEMEHAGRLGASFFCSRSDPESQDASRIVPTIAHQLARLVPSYCEALIQEIGEDKDIGQWDTETQFLNLIQAPLSKTKLSELKGIVVTIDALDECDGRDSAQNIFNALSLHGRDLPLKFCVTSRPETGLSSSPQSRNEGYHSVLQLHGVEVSLVQADIVTFLEAELASISLPRENLERLAEQSGALFIYAATAVRYIHPKVEKVDVHRRLEEVLAVTYSPDNNKDDHINKLYTIVLTTPFTNEVVNPREKRNIRLVLDTVIHAKEPMSIAIMTKLLGLSDEQDIHCALRYLYSVLHVSQDTNLIATWHASFPDFMLNRERSKDLYWNATQYHRHLSLCCFSTMERQLRFNICELESSFDLDENVPHIAERVEKSVSPELLYACQYWPDHLVASEPLEDVRSALEGFLSSRLLFWMEVLNLKRCIHVGAGGLGRVRAWTERSGCSMSLRELARDAARFVKMFSSNAVSRSTPHIYVSALAFWPEGRPVTKHYAEKFQGVSKAIGTGMRRRQAVFVTHSSVCCVAYSSNGACIISGSEDGSIQIWNAYTGEQIGDPLEGHTHPVWSVSYSSDSTRIVSGSMDHTMRIWDAHTGKQIGEPLQGHTNWVNAVRYSSDGTRIVSGSDDHTIRIWDAHTGKQIGEPLEGHTCGVMSVGYSSDGTRIVSGSGDRTIRIWDAHTRKQIGEPLKGHTNWLRSVGYSPDGTRIVSGSGDRTIRIWDAHTGKQIGKPLKGHTNWVMSVGYSSDGTRIVSGSFDHTIRIWDADTGKQIGEPLKGHTNWVMSVGCSSDGTRVVSGSYDRTIRVWDAHTGQQIGDPLVGHTSTDMPVGCSSGGARIVSGSDNTIHIHNLDPLFNDPCSTWVLDQDGFMLTGSSKLLMWVPYDMRDSLLHPQNTAVISRQASVTVDFAGTCVGTSWSQCYQSS